MGIMPDSWIRKMAMQNKMIEPFVDKLEKKKCSFLWSFILWL